MKWLTSVVLVLAPSVAGAHIHLTSPLSRTDMPTGEQKVEHCGVAGYSRAAHPERVTTFTPGQTITVTWAETINHPGHFRIAFQPNGEIFKIPQPGGTGTPAGYPFINEEGLDQGNGSIVLADQIVDGTTSKQITLPNMECSNCTLQVIQVMTDKAPYTTDAASDDIYFNCADLILAGSAPAGDAGTTGPDAQPGGQVNGGGCSTTEGSSTVLLVALGLVGLRRRRHR